jgi:hypothetical protein
VLFWSESPVRRRRFWNEVAKFLKSQGYRKHDGKWHLRRLNHRIEG